MTEKTFIGLLREYGINPEIVCFNDGVKDDVFCVMENYGTIEVFYRERGSKFNLKVFATKTEALSSLFEEILAISGLRKK